MFSLFTLCFITVFKNCKQTCPKHVFLVYVVFLIFENIKQFSKTLNKQTRIVFFENSSYPLNLVGFFFFFVLCAFQNKKKM